MLQLRGINLDRILVDPATITGPEYKPKEAGEFVAAFFEKSFRWRTVFRIPIFETKVPVLRSDLVALLIKFGVIEDEIYAETAINLLLARCIPTRINPGIRGYNKTEDSGYMLVSKEEEGVVTYTLKKYANRANTPRT